MRCLKCGKEFDGETEFCSSKCRNAHNSHQRYLKLKDDPEFKRRAKERLNKWLAEGNRGHFNDLCRERSRLYGAKKRAEAKARGDCSMCFREKEDDGYITCINCRSKYKKRNS